MISSALGFLVKPELVPDRISECRECPHVLPDLRSRRQHSAAGGLDTLERVRDRVHHDVRAGALIRRPVALLHPCAAHTAGIVERQLAIASRSHLPAEDGTVKLRRGFGSLRGDFQITDLAVGHEERPPSSSYVSAEDAAATSGSRYSSRYIRISSKK